MKTPFSSKSKFIWIASLTLAVIGGFTLRVLNADYFAPADTCEEVVRYMSGCSLSCSDSGPVGRYSCEKSIDEPGMQETTCTRHPYNPAITGRENGFYESSYQLGNCTVTCGGGHAMCKGDAPVRSGSVPPSTTLPTTEPEHPSGPITGDTKTGTCQGSIPANGSGTSPSTYTQTYTSSSRIPADNLSRTYSATPGTCSFTCSAGYDWDGSACKAPTVPTVTYNGYVIMDRNLGASQVCTSLTDANCYGNYYQRGNNYPMGNSSVTTYTPNSSTAVSAAGYGPSNPFSSSTFIKLSQRDSSDNRNLRGGQGDTTSANGVGTHADRQGPCPAGFHVPSILERKNMLNGANPYSLFSTLKIPLAGFRHSSGASPANVGSYGYCWSSSPDANAGSAYNFNFYSSNVAPQYNTNGRGIGLAVRCFQNS